MRRACVFARARARASKSPLIPFICTAGIRIEGRGGFRAVDVLTSRCFLVSLQTDGSPVSWSLALAVPEIDNPL